MTNRIKRIIFFFPLQLLWVHLKKNHLMLFFWMMLFGFVTKSIGLKYGIPYLFLYPEYLESVDFISHMILGFGVGGFIMAFNISSYITNGFRFPFIATLARPFIKYCINNFIIPVGFILYHVSAMIKFQATNEFIDGTHILINVSGYLTGIFIFLFLALTYFFSTNKNISKLFGVDIEPPLAKQEDRKSNPLGDVLHKKEKWYNVFNRSKQWRIETYMSEVFRISLARDSNHYDRAMIEKVFAQNHINASYFQIFVIVSLISLGLLKEYEIMMIPAGATVLLSFTMFLMLISALHSWLQGWSTTIFILLFLIVNQLSQFASFNYMNYAYGMNYNTEKSPYTTDHLKALQNNHEVLGQDYTQTLETLDNWKFKNHVKYKDQSTKPKLILLNVSGGGIRAALWSFRALQYADSLTNNKLLDHTFMVSGSSGGMIGTAYLRENFLSNKENMHDITLAENISKDILNSVTYSWAVNDMFIRLQTFQVGEHTYTKDRGFAFEQQLNRNTNYVLDKKLRDYRKPVLAGEIPMMVFSPTITNDGRKLLMSSTDISYLTDNHTLHNITNENLPESVDFNRLFEKQGANDLLFTSALRMNATFPYIMPNPSLPTEPTIEVMDAGARDNFGTSLSIKFVHQFKNWLMNNTSGIVILQVRDKKKEFPIKNNPLKTIATNLSNPIGGFYGNWAQAQTFNQDDLIQYLSNWYPGKVDVVSLQLVQNKNEEISLSWHLTNKEKKNIFAAIHSKKNQLAIAKLSNLLK